MKKIKVYTDGSCLKNPGPGGYAMVFVIDGRSWYLSGCEGSTTNNRMELKAVLNALIEIELDEDHRCEYEIYSDSAYVVNSINKGWLQAWGKNGWKTGSGDLVKNQDIWVEVTRYLKTLKRLGVKVKFIKVKGHSGNCYNEMCDKLAKEAAAMAKSEVHT